MLQQNQSNLYKEIAMDMGSTTLKTAKEETVYTDYMRDEWNVLFTELPDGDGLVQFFDSRQDVLGHGRYITAARISELENFVKTASKRDNYFTADGVKIARKRLDNVLKWVRPRVEQSLQRKLTDTSSMLFAAIHGMATQRPVCN